VTSPRLGEQGLTGLQELAVAIGIAALLGVGGLFTYRVLVNGSNDRSVQASISSALTAANDVYQEDQDYALISTPSPATGGASSCALDTTDFSAMKAYASDVKFSCRALGTYRTGSVVFSTGELADGNAGGWIGLAAMATDGTCWQAYKPADGPTVYGSHSAATCPAPTAAPAGGSLDW
jgi:hypothetical protein